MNGQSLQQAFIPLPSSQAVYTSAGLAYYRDQDHLGSSRLATTPNQTLYSSTAYAPFGENYVQAGATDTSFTGIDQDTVTGVSGLYDFLFRRQSPSQGRWLSPDPAGLAAVDFQNPQTWNRYVYVNNNPLALIDPLGLYIQDPSCRPGDLFCECPIDRFCDLEGIDIGGAAGDEGGGGRGGRPPRQPSGSAPNSGPPNGETLGLPGGLNAQPFGNIWNLYGLFPNLGCGDFVACGSLGPPGVSSFSAGSIAIPVAEGIGQLARAGRRCRLDYFECCFRDW